VELDLLLGCFLCDDEEPSFLIFDRDGDFTTVWGLGPKSYLLNQNVSISKHKVTLFGKKCNFKFRNTFILVFMILSTIHTKEVKFFLLESLLICMVTI